jgi:hypothetical protein
MFEGARESREASEFIFCEELIDAYEALFSYSSATDRHMPDLAISHLVLFEANMDTMSSEMSVGERKKTLKRGCVRTQESIFCWIFIVDTDPIEKNEER